MARRLLSIRKIRSVNYSIFHDLLGVIPTLRTQDERNSYKLKDLQYSPLHSDPDKPKLLAAKTLRKVYEESGFAIQDVSELLLDPGEQTMNDLAQFIKDNHIPRFSVPIGAADANGAS